MSSSNPFGLISTESSMFMYEALTQKVFFVDFPKWPIMSKFISSCEWIFLNFGAEDGLYGIRSYLKWALDGSFLIKYEKDMLGQSWVDFSYKTLI